MTGIYFGSHMVQGEEQEEQDGERKIPHVLRQMLEEKREGGKGSKKCMYVRKR